MNNLKKIFSFQKILLAAIAVAISVRLIVIGRREFWYDEVLSLLLSNGQKVNYFHPGTEPINLDRYTAILQLPIELNGSDFLQTLEQLLKGLVVEPHPPLFFLLQHFWLRLFGSSEIAMRSLPCLVSIGCIGCAYGLGRKLLGNQGGLLFAALLGLNPYFLFHSLNVRMYCLLVFWIILSTWSLLELIENRLGMRETKTQQKDDSLLSQHRRKWLIIFTVSLVGGMMTFYYFAVWLLMLGIIILCWDRRRWWQYGICYAIAIILISPWVWWGTRQQLRNADLGRFTTSGNWLETATRHIQDAIQVLGIHLLIGDWATILPPIVIFLVGIVAVILLIAAIKVLWDNQQYQLLGRISLLSWCPFFLMILVDVVNGKFTVGFGWGRSVIFILPGCLLLITAGLTYTQKVWRQSLALTLLTVYLVINLGDYSLRSRWMFHEIADMIASNSQSPILIVMNSSAWGHVLRLAYYHPNPSSVDLLAINSKKLIPQVDKLLSSSPQYEQIVWLDSEKPVWGKPSSKSELSQLDTIFDKTYQLSQTKHLKGTWVLDNFQLNLYQKL